MPEIPTWRFIAKVEEIPSGKQRVFQLGEHSIILCRVYQEVFAVKNHCPHLGKTMDNARLQEYELICPHHNACFDIRDGHPVTGPAVTGLTNYAVKVVEGEVYVDLAAEDAEVEFKDPRVL